MPANSAYISPLRYPGGKAQLTAFLAFLVSTNGASRSCYVEPFAGGAGAALGLLLGEHVEAIHLNDLHPGIAAFWTSILHQTDEFLDLLRTTEVSIETWKHHRAVLLAADKADALSLGFATFFLNRTNRSGIIGARPIGGLAQRGRWKIDARFNKTDLERRIRRIAAYRHRIEVTGLDAVDLVQQRRQNDKLFWYLDPPYLAHGSDLYLDELSWDGHRRLASAVTCVSSPWVVTYDLDEKVGSRLYPKHRFARFDLAHTAARQHIGSETAVFSRGLRVPRLDLLGRTGGEWCN